jgi:uncharacterized membrane protein
MPGESPTARSYAAVFALLAAATAVCVALVGGRMVFSHTIHLRFLVWNLFLAWIPLALAWAACRLAARPGDPRYLVLVPAVVWLLFFPNAPYIVTDFLHLGQYPDNVPAWFDVMLIAWFAWTGLLLGVVSLRMMHDLVRHAAGSRTGWLFVVAVTALGSLGVYVGRFLRWNSWNVFQDPLRLADSALERAARPDAGELLLGFTALFALLFLFVYATTYVLARPRDERPDCAGGQRD